MTRNAQRKKIAGDVQSSDVNFALHTLGWKSFQDLCAEVARETLRRAIEIYRPAKDGGRDAAFLGRWSGKETKTDPKISTIQCKFSSVERRSLRLSDIAGEKESIRDLVSKGLAEGYVLMTNMSVSGTTAACVREWLIALGVRVPLVLGREAITHCLKSNPRLRALVPRVYGLGDLAWIEDQRRIDQARATLQRLGKEGLNTYVPTDAHRRAVHALHEYGLVMLIGEPASGKSTIAAILAANALDLEATDIVRVDRPEQFTASWNVNEARRFFWVDDAFGANRLNPAFVDQWSREWPSVKTALSQGNKFVFTTRDYIWAEAKNDLRLSIIPALSQDEESKVEIDLADLTEDEKSQILYNHIKLGNQTKGWRKSIATFLPQAAKHSRFLPEVARRLGLRAFTQQLTVTADGIEEFVRAPRRFLVETIEGLPHDCRAALALMFIEGGSLESPLSQNDQVDLIRQHFGCDLPQLRSALQRLKDSMVLLIADEGTMRWVYRHPTILDAYSDVVAKTPEAVEIFIRGSRPDDLFAQLCCGPSKQSGDILDVPQKLEGILIDRFSSFEGDTELNDKLFSFLSDRVEERFLQRVATSIRPILERDGRWYYPASVTPKVRLIELLNSIGLASKSQRTFVIGRLMRDLRSDGEARFLVRASLMALFAPSELKRLKKEIVSVIIPRLSEYVDDIRASISSDQDADDAFYNFRRSLSALREFCDKDVHDDIDEAEQLVDEIVENWSQDYEPPDDDELIAPSAALEETKERSIFDDLHE